MGTMLADYLAATTQNHDRVVSITSGDYIIVYGGCHGSAGAVGATSASVISGSGLALTKIDEALPGAGSRSLAVAYGGFATATGSVTIRVSFSAAPTIGATYIEAESGVDTTTPFYKTGHGDGATATTPAPAFGSALVSSDKAKALFVMRNKTSAATVGNLTLIKAGFTTTPSAGFLIEGGTGLTLTTATASAMTTNWNAGVVFALKAAAAPSWPTDAAYVWDGSALVACDTYVWNGTSLDQVDPYFWDGSTLV